MSESGRETPEDYGEYSVDDEDQQPSSDTLDDDDVADPLDRGYSPPDRYSATQHYGTTPWEEEHRETIDQRMAQEEPEPDPYDRPPEDAIIDGDVDDGEVGGERSGRLVAPDEGAHADDEPDMVGDDVGIDGAAASAEEAAVHVVPEESEERG